MKVRNRSIFTRYICLILLFLPGVAVVENISHAKAWALKKKLLEYRNDSAMHAFLDTIAQAEGTYCAGAKGYQMCYPGSVSFTSFDNHPGIVHCALYKKRELCSSASGRYMLLRWIWEEVSRRLDLKDFSPLNQDLAAIYLMYEKRAIEDIQKEKFKEAVDKVKGIWSSLPGSQFNQPTKSYGPLKKFFEERLKHYNRIKTEGGWRLW